LSYSKSGTLLLKAGWVGSWFEELGKAWEGKGGNLKTIVWEPRLGTIGRGTPFKGLGD